MVNLHNMTGYAKIVVWRTVVGPKSASVRLKNDDAEGFELHQLHLQYNSVAYPEGDYKDAPNPNFTHEFQYFKYFLELILV